MSIVLGQRSLSRLEGVHPDLVRVVKKAAALSDLDFTVLEGIRSVERQKQLVAQGASKTMNSRHITGHAVDLAPMIGGEVRWDWGLYLRLGEVMRAASLNEKVPIRWGGTWKLLSAIEGPITAKILSRSFPDGPHFEIDPSKHPYT
ncbi:M15 family metallopeptidase [Sphingorhabdus sp.]|uniref:M15 family metallopeptidase n=1 Tax=Sphingorhabdus sp. TaxID=1902408 RepID=UPI00333F9F69